MGKRIGIILLYILVGTPIMLIFFNIINPIKSLVKRDIPKEEKGYGIIFGIYMLLMILFFFLVPVVSLIMLIAEYLLLTTAMILVELTKKEATGLGKSAPQNSSPGAGGIFAGLDSVSAKKLFRTLVKKYHPDSGHGDNETMKEIVREYEVYKGNKNNLH
ncbi:MAG: hypothetical protein K6E47_02130 [Lachnospiraceae bacterium]|nr:hypothetical protein [Lachnospiraceae bacterium]